MKLHRFIGNFPLHEKRFWISDKDLAHQMRSVLRIEVGEHVVLCDGHGNEAEAVVRSYDARAVEVEIVAAQKHSMETARSVVLYLAVLKKENFELVVQKATEVGIAEIVPMITARTVKTSLNESRMIKIATEAAEQSGRTTVPVVHAPIMFADAVERASAAHAINWFFDIGGDAILPMRDTRPTIRDAGIFIGPEGGWIDDERAIARSRSLKRVSLGPLTLRAETAAIVASYLACSR